MAKRTFLAGATSQTIDVFVQDSSSLVGAGLSGLSFNTSGLKCYYRKGATGSATAVTLATQTVGGAWSSGGFVEIDATNMKGVYRFDVPDTVLASTPWATLYFYGATNMAPVVAEVEIVSFNPFDSVRMGLTALPNAAAEASGGLYTRGTGAGQINQDANGRIDANVKTWIGGAIPSVNVTGVPLVDLKYTLGTVSPATAGSVRADAVTGAVGSVTGLTASNLDATVSSRLAASGYTAPLDAAATRSAVGLAAANLDTQLAEIEAETDDIAAVKTQTDKLAFTVPNQLDANIQYVNDVQVNGVGTAGSPWGP